MEEKEELTFYDELKKGVIRENPLLVLMVGLCSLMAVSTSVESGIFMGICATFVLVSSNLIISLIRRWIPPEIRIPIFIVVIASFVTVVDLVLHAYFPAIYDKLGVWIPLIVVNCMILARAEGYAYKYPVLVSIADGIGMGIGYSVVLITMAFVREVFGTGKIILFDHEISILGSTYSSNAPAILIAFPGAFLTFAFMLALMNYYKARKLNG